MGEINGYKLLGELTSRNAGFCLWGFCERAGREYFIKEFISPKYPVDTKDLSAKQVERKRKICERFYADKKEFYDVLSNCRTGNNILIQSFFRSGPRYYIVTDIVNSDGTDPALISGMTKEKKEVLIRSLLFSIAKLHEHGIVHADLKPDNILLKKTTAGYYTAKIIDFDSGFLIGKTPDEIQGDQVYLAPEVFLKMGGEDITLNEKLDIFALGVLLHQYWTGELPKISSDYQFIFEAVLDGSTVQLSSDIPVQLRIMISRMLSSDPASRPSAKEILAMYRAYDITKKSDPPAPPPPKKGFYVPKDLD